MTGQTENAFDYAGGSGICFHPSEAMVNGANVTGFMKKHGIGTYESLLEKAANDPDWFYPAVFEELSIPWMKGYERVLDVSGGPELPLWFKGGLTNLYLYGLQKHIDQGNGGRTALIWEGEDGAVIRKTFREIKRETDRLAAGLKALGIRKGDAVGIFVPQIPEIPAILFACAKIGAIAVPCFSGFGTDAVAARLTDAEAKCLFTVDGFRRRGKVIPLAQKSAEVARLVHSLENIVVIANLRRQEGEAGTKGEGNWLDYEAVLSLSEEDVPIEPMDATEPYMILYTSGTTGKPKGTLHTHFSFPLKNAIDMYFCFDLKKDDRMFWLTDLGWMMGPWLVFGTAVNGAAMVIYEGSPDYPDENRLWELVEKHRITIFGVAPTVIRSLMRQEAAPADAYDLSSLRILGSTGEPWNPKPWFWYFEKVGGKRCPVINYSGGTEISGGILGCVPILPQKPCSFHGPVPGMAAAVVDQQGNPVWDSIGDLVVTKPFLGMTYSFWKDHQRYLEAYWSRWTGLWHHGDFAKIDRDGFWYILGRSDDTMNVAGKRLGPADLESVAVMHPLIKESACIGVPDEVKGEAPVLFAVPGGTLPDPDAVKEEIRTLIAEKLGKSFLPKEVHFVPQLPRTQSGKIARRLVRAAYLGQEPGDVSTLQNPESLTSIRGPGTK